MPGEFRVAVIGSTGRGDYGHSHDTVWLSVPETQIVAVADDNPDGLAQAMARLSLDKGYNDYRVMLDETKPDIVAICPRWINRHHDMMKTSVERGIHVYVEKPMCRTLAEADDIIRTAETTHARIVVAHQTRYSPKLAAVKRLTDEGRLGRVLEYRGRGKEDHRGGGEDLWVLGSHVMDMIRALGGSPEWCFASVTADGHPITSRDVAEGNEGIGPLAGDHVEAMYGMPKGATAYFASHRRAAGSPSRFGLRILGTEGVLDMGFGYLPPVKFLPDSSWSPGQTDRKWLDVSSVGIGQAEPLEDGGLQAGNELAVRDLIAAIQDNREPIMNAAEARAAIEMIVACFESSRVGGRVELPLENRENPLSRLTG